MAKADKSIFFDSDECVKPFGGSEDNSLELSAVCIVHGIPGHTKMHTVPCEYLFGLEMTLEDIRSHFIEKSFPLDQFQVFSKYYENCLDPVDSFYNQKTEHTEIDRKDCSKSKIASNLKIESLEKINDFFFSNIDLVESMEKVYKDEIDSEYLCGKYEKIIRELFYDQELQKLANERAELEREKKKLIERKNEFKVAKRNIEQQNEYLKLLISENSNRVNEFNKKKQELDQAIKTFEEEKLQFDKKKEEFDSNTDYSLTPRSSLASEKSPRRNEESLENFKSILETIKLALETKSPPEVAVCLIEEIKQQIKVFHKYRKVDATELKCMEHAWKIRAKAFEKYEMVRKNELIISQKNADVELMKLKNLADKKSKNCQNFETLAAIRQKKKELVQTEEELKLIMNTIYSLQYEIVNSIEHYKEIFNEILKQNMELKKNIKLLRIVEMNY